MWSLKLLQASRSKMRLSNILQGLRKDEIVMASMTSQKFITRMTKPQKGNKTCQPCVSSFFAAMLLAAAPSKGEADDLDQVRVPTHESWVHPSCQKGFSSKYSPQKRQVIAFYDCTTGHCCLSRAMVRSDLSPWTTGYCDHFDRQEGHDKVP